MNRERIQREEDYREGLGLLAEQREFYEIWKAQRNFQRGLHDIPFMGIGFKPRPIFDPVNGRHTIRPFGPNRAIVPPSTVSVVSVTRVPTQHWVGANRNRRWRWNCLVHPISVQDGELIVAGAYADRRPEQYDCSLLPLQDHPVVDVIHFDENATIPFDPVLRAPTGGQFRTRRSELHLDLLVNRTPVFRIDLRDVDNVVLHATWPELAAEGQFVRPGDPLASLTGKVTYGEVALGHDGRPAIERIGRGDILPASRKRPLLRIVNKLLGAMTAAAAGEQTPDDWELPAAFSDWAPRHLVELDRATFETLRVQESWQATDRLKRDVLIALRPGGTLQREPCPVPAGDYCWNQLQQSLGSSLGWLETAFLDRTAIRNGSFRQGDGVLIDAEYLPTGFVAAKPVGHWLDLRPGIAYFDPVDGFIAGPPVRHEDLSDVARFVNGIGYDFRPAGNRFSVTPLRETSSRCRGRRRVAA